MGGGFAMRQSALERERRTKEREAKAAWSRPQWKGCNGTTSDGAAASNPFDVAGKMRQIKLEQQQKAREAKEMYNATRSGESEIDKNVRKQKLEQQQKALS